MYLNKGDKKGVDETLDQVIKATYTSRSLLQAVVNGNTQLEIEIEAPDMLQAYWKDPSRFVEVLRREREKVLISEHQENVFYSVLPQDGTEDVELMLAQKDYDKILREVEQAYMRRLTER